MAELCLIFDLDGTLVDSEALCNQAFLDLIPNINSSLDDLISQNRGRKLSEIFSDLEASLGIKLPVSFERTYRDHVATLFADDLKPVSGVTEMLDALDRRRCIASSGPREKIEQALKVTGLHRYFDSNVFSSYEVQSWKPDPGLFLYAAEQMGVDPSGCVVVEDSLVGIQAATAAGMVALHYRPQPSCASDGTSVVFQEMSQLPGLLAHLEAQRFGVC